MSMNLTVYVGPYLIVPKPFEWYDFERLITDGRCEAAEQERDWYLVPNSVVAGIDRQLRFEKYDEVPVVQIETTTICDELMRFRWHVEPLIVHCQVRGINIRMEWGVVPCWG